MKRARSGAASLSFPICTKKEIEGWFKPQHNAVLLRLRNLPGLKFESFAGEEPRENGAL